MCLVSQKHKETIKMQSVALKRRKSANCKKFPAKQTKADIVLLC
ncbi:unnamed protein product [Callosobruchus maculatus]|uniref:Uncharacterized protein n=1 Tax=Callosobruchus maculatus TaxID=64391 RepID=A0A653CNM4_CALMS|nr:unnamed protein product [Callosobruchus maculatus]